jgi:nucleotide-binding universal stress UspA family protein
LTAAWTGASGSTGYLEAALAAMHEQAQAAARDFERQVAALGVFSYESRVVDGDVSPVMALHARYSDLSVITQPEPGQWLDEQSPLLAPELLLHSGRPLLMLPAVGEPPQSLGSRVLVGWDGSREAARALADALPLLERAASVQVAVFEAPRASDGRHGALPGADIGQWLARHGVNVEVQHLVTEVAVGDALLSHAYDWQADLIVVGGYGHSRFRETMLGGVTRTLLRSSPVPVLMSH